jgi:hypothetical protein
MSDSRRGKKQNANKSYAARAEWMTGKKIGRKKQEWVNVGSSAVEVSPGIVTFTEGYWRKI